MVDDKTMSIITGLIVFAIGVIFAAVGSGFEGAAQTASYVIGGAVIIGGLVIFIRGVK